MNLIIDDKNIFALDSGQTDRYNTINTVCNLCGDDHTW